MPPTRVATTGIPAASASMHATGQQSARLARPGDEPHRLAQRAAVDGALQSLGEPALLAKPVEAAHLALVGGRAIGGEDRRTAAELAAGEQRDGDAVDEHAIDFAQMVL